MDGCQRGDKERRCRKHQVQQGEGGDKIDGIIAMIMALGEMMTMENKDVTGTSTYESQGIRML